MFPNPQDVTQEIVDYSYANILKGKGKAKATEPSPPKRLNIRQALTQSSCSGSNQKPKSQSIEQQPAQPTIDDTESQSTLFPSPRSSDIIVSTPSTLDLDVGDILKTYTKAMHIVHAWLAWHGFGSPGSTVEPSALLLHRAERARDEAKRTGNLIYVPGAREIWALKVALECWARMRELWEAKYPQGEAGGVSGAGEYGHLV